MDQKREIDVLINQKKYTICAYESEEYIQKLASYLNNKYQEFKAKDSYCHLPSEFRNILLEINLVDDYFKLQKNLKELEEDNSQKGAELYQLRRDLTELSSKYEKLKQELSAERDNRIENEKKIVKLETALLERGFKKENQGRK